jgi:hypothetical protein
MRFLPKNKKGGVVTNTVMGIGGLIIGVIVILVITSTLLDAGLFEGSKASTTELNEVTTVINSTGYTFGDSNLLSAVCSIDSAVNSSGFAITSANYSVTSSSCSVTNTSAEFGGETWVINSTTSYAGTGESSSSSLQGNFTDGIGNISKKVPTILLIVAVVFLFGALALLIRNAGQMGVGSGSSL